MPIIQIFKFQLIISENAGKNIIKNCKWLFLPFLKVKIEQFWKVLKMHAVLLGLLKDKFKQKTFKVQHTSVSTLYSHYNLITPNVNFSNNQNKF